MSELDERITIFSNDLVQPVNAEEQRIYKKWMWHLHKCAVIKLMPICDGCLFYQPYPVRYEIHRQYAIKVWMSLKDWMVNDGSEMNSDGCGMLCEAACRANKRADLQSAVRRSLRTHVRAAKRDDGGPPRK
ncbi:hypothetical protein GPALN_010310 [Globodera pallida]|nr:hypothetical protein GPALN_010310 [Globodera pallida]